MAKTRMINTSFWSDSYIQELDKETKLFFLYLLTNEHTDICGIYEITIKTICFETGLPENSISKAIDRLSKDNKISFYKNWVYIKNFAKHQQNNPKVKRGIEIGKERVPKAIYDSLCIGYDTLSHSNSNSNLNSNSKSQTKISDEIKKLSDFLYECIKRNNPKFGGDPRKWDDAFDKVLRIDKRPYDDVIHIIRFAQTDNFWKSNILSGEKLRKQYDQLSMKAQQNSITVIS